MPAVSDTELVRRSQTGDADAFAALVSRYQDRLYNLCWRMCRQDADALDHTQAVFLRALEALPRFEARANFYTWLYRIAVNHVLTAQRTARRRGDVSLEVVGDGFAERTSASPPRVAEEHEDVERVRRALAELPEDYRVVVVLRDIEDMDYATIAEVLELPAGTVKSRIHRARQLLAERLGVEERNRGIA